MITTPPEDRGSPRFKADRERWFLEMREDLPLGFGEPDSACQCCGRRCHATSQHCPRCGGRNHVRRQSTAPVNLSELADQIAHDLND